MCNITKIRNDDVAYDTSLEEIKNFCEICDKHDIKIIHCITLRGNCQPIDSKMTNDEIQKDQSDFLDNKEVVEYLKTRNDDIAVHGLWHTHTPTQEDTLEAIESLRKHDLPAKWFVPPFNEGDYPREFCGLKVLQHIDRLESFLDDGEPKTEEVYLHSWRFNNKWFTFKQLDDCLTRLCQKK